MREAPFVRPRYHILLDSLLRCLGKVSMKAMKLLVVSALAVSAAFDQIQAGRTVGTVSDPNKAVIPNAQVTVTGTATNQAKTVTTNETGEYAVTPLDPGLYNVVVTVAGFQTTQVNNVEVVVYYTFSNSSKAATNVACHAASPLICWVVRR